MAGEGLDRLREIYGELDDLEKGQVIRLAEGLLCSQGGSEDENQGVNYGRKWRV